MFTTVKPGQQGAMKSQLYHLALIDQCQKEYIKR